MRGSKSGYIYDYTLKYGKGKGLIGGKWIKTESVGPMPATPFFRPAVEKNKANMKRRYIEEIEGKFW